MLSRVYGEISYRVGKSQRLTCDATVDLGTDLVLVEVTAKRLTAKSVVEADAESLRTDLQRMVIEKMDQLGRVIRDIFEDHSRVPELDLKHVHRIWPVVVVGDSLFQSPSFWSYIQNEGGRFLEIPRSVVSAQIQRLVLLDVEELEVLMGLVSQGHPLTDILERKTTTLWVERDLKSLVWGTEYRHRWAGEVPFISAELDRALRGLIRSLGVHGRYRAVDDASPERQAA